MIEHKRTCSERDCLPRWTPHLREVCYEVSPDAVALMAHCDRATRCFDENGWIKPLLKKTIPDMCKSQGFAGENSIILRVIPFPAALCSDPCHPGYLY